MANAVSAGIYIKLICENATVAVHYLAMVVYVTYINVKLASF